MRRRLSLKVGISGVRGIVGDSLTPRLAGRLAAAFATYAGPGKIVIGRDARPSGGMLVNAVTAGLLAAGCRPVDVGICPIPSALLLTKALGARGGIMVTASHNPPEWNGLKFLSARGLYLNPSEVQEFLDIYHQGDFAYVGAAGHKTVVAEPEPARRHLARLLEALDPSLIRRKAVRVAADCSNGAGAVLMPAFLEALGCRATFINVEPGGAFARPSEPTAENLGRLCRTVRRSGSEVGLAQDADADRLAVIDESGQALGEDLTLALAVKHVLGKTPGPVVVNLSASRAIDDLARAAGVPVYRTRIGETNVVEEMLARGAVIGGEGNGGVIWPRVHPCRDSFAAAGLVLQAMAESGRSISELRREIPFYAMVRDKIPGTQEDAPRLLGALRRAHGREVISTLDGLKMRFGEDAWAHVRPSNTEPIIRLQVEAATRRRAGALMARLKREIAALP